MNRRLLGRVPDHGQRPGGYAAAFMNRLNTMRSHGSMADAPREAQSRVDRLAGRRGLLFGRPSRHAATSAATLSHTSAASVGSMRAEIKRPMVIVARRLARWRTRSESTSPRAAAWLAVVAQAEHCGRRVHGHISRDADEAERDELHRTSLRPLLSDVVCGPLIEPPHDDDGTAPSTTESSPKPTSAIEPARTPPAIAMTASRLFQVMVAAVRHHAHRRA
jgi:hypothetical protein